MFRSLSATRFAKEIIRKSRSRSESPGPRLLSTQENKKPFNLQRDEYISGWHFPHEEGCVINSPYETTTIPNLPLDQYAWKNMNQWQNHIAMVGIVYS